MKMDEINKTTAVFADFNTLSGLEFLRKQMQTSDQSPMAQIMGMKIVSVEAGVVKIEATPSERFYNPMMRVHGGFAATLIDSCMGSAVLSKLPAGTGVGTIVLNVNYVGKIDAATGVLTATGTVLHAGRTMLTAEAKLTDVKGKLLAHGTGTFLVYPKPV